MNTLIKITTLIVLLLTATSCFVDGLAGVRGNGNVLTENRNLNSNFNEVQVQQGIQVYLTQDNTTTLKVEADENIIDLLKTEIKDNKLKIYFEKNVYKASSKKVFVSVAEISKISTSSGATVKTENTFTTNTLKLESSSGSSIKVYVNAHEISSSSSSGANINIYGKSKDFYASASSGSAIDADQLETLNATAKVSSGANINIHVSGKLIANASSGGDIDYEGNPTEIDKNTSSGGSVSGS
jgi:hypothetical protein